jgi:glycerophosphoryl diester phosphodiesterase
MTYSDGHPASSRPQDRRIQAGVSCLRIGHGGASALAPANTLASFDAALAVGIDMVEFDVRAYRGELVLAHTLFDLPRGRSVPLAAALAHLQAPRFDGVQLNVDLKRIGGEAELLAALRDAGLLPRTLISSQVTAVLDRVRALDPSTRIGISVGGRVARASRRWDDWRAAVLAGLEARRWQTVMLQHRLIDEAMLLAVVQRGGVLYAWTANDRRLIAALREFGVHGITTADPRLFT